MRRKLNRSLKGTRWIALDRNEAVVALICGCSWGMARIIARTVFPDLMYELTVVPERNATGRQIDAALLAPVLTRDDVEKPAAVEKRPIVKWQPPVKLPVKLEAPKAEKPSPAEEAITTGIVRLWKSKAAGGAS